MSASAGSGRAPRRWPLLESPAVLWGGLGVLAGVVIFTGLIAFRWWADVQSNRGEARWRADMAAEAGRPPAPRAVLPWLEPRSGNAADAYAALLGPGVHVQGPGQQVEAELSAWYQAHGGPQGYSHAPPAPAVDAILPPIGATLEHALVQFQLTIERLEAGPLVCETIAWPGGVMDDAPDWLGNGFTIGELLLADARRASAAWRERDAVRRAAAGAALAADIERHAGKDTAVNPWSIRQRSSRSVHVYTVPQLEGALLRELARERRDPAVLRDAIRALRALIEREPRTLDLLRRERLRAGANSLERVGRLPHRRGYYRGIDTFAKAGWAGPYELARQAETAFGAKPWAEAAPAIAYVGTQMWSGPFGVYNGPSPITIASTGVDMASRRRLALIAAAARLHALETGALPAALDDLVPRFLDAVPLDPLTNKPFAASVDPKTGELVLALGPPMPNAPPPAVPDPTREERIRASAK